MSRAHLSVLPLIDGDSSEWIVGYGRVSSKEQAKGDSVQGQAPSCDQLAVRHGKRLIAYFFDKPHSGKRVYGRKGLEAAVAFAKEQRLHIVARDTTRLHRNDDEFRDFERRVARPAGIRFLTNDGWRRHETAGDFLQTRAQDMFSTMYSLDIGDKTRDGKYQARLRGYWPDQTPYGYKRRGQFINGQWMLAGESEPVADPTARELVPDPDTAPIAREIKDRLMRGESHDAIAAALTDDQIPGPKGGPWYESTIFYMANNPLYAGMITYRGRILLDSEANPIRLKGEPLWDEATYNAIRARGKPPVRAKEDRYLFAGLLVTSHYICTAPRGKLGKPMPLLPKSQTKTDALWYKPAHLFERLYLAEPHDDLAGELPHQLDARHLDKELLDKVIRLSKLFEDNTYEPPLPTDKQYYERLRAEYSRKCGQLADARQLRDNAIKLMMPTEAMEYRDKVLRLQAEVDELKARKVEASRPLRIPKHRAVKSNSLETAYMRGDFATCKQMLRDMIDYIDVRVTGPWFYQDAERIAPLRFEIHWRDQASSPIKAESPEERAVIELADISSSLPLRLHTGKRGRPTTNPRSTP